MRISISGGLVLLALLGACGDGGRRQGADLERGVECSADGDGDGYGEGCALGPDCDDEDRLVHQDCGTCARPQQGCDCADGTAPVSCFLAPLAGEDGALLCQEGTRFCRDGAWSGCESIHSYPMPDSSTTAIIDPNAPPVQCSDCNVKCFVIRDNLDPVDGLASTGAGVDWAAGGGLQLGTTTTIWEQDAGVQDGGTVTGPLACMPGTAPDTDCDGILDTYDPFPFARPFATTNPAIFLDLAPGETGTGVIELVFFMNTIDVYFLLDQTDSMNSVKQRLHGALLNGTFLAAAVECSDTDLDGLPNQELKDQGVLGGIRCLLRNAQVGAGYLREIPFSTYGNDDEVTFRHMLDMTLDNQAAIDAIGSFTIDRDVDWPDAHPLALYSLVTAEGLYMGVGKPGVPPRTDCPEGTWGYACFRPDAIPVVLLFTDSPMHEGPDVIDRDFRYDPSLLTITAGSQLTYEGVPPNNDALTVAYDLGELSNRNVTFTGTTAPLSSDYGHSFMSCVATGKDAARDAAFAFTLAAPTTLTYSTAGTDFDASVAVYNRVIETPVALSRDGSNEHAGVAHDLGEMALGWNVVSGSTQGMGADYAEALVGCNADSASPDAVYRFSLARSTRIALDTTGSSFDTVMALYDDAPALPTSFTASNTNDTVMAPFELGDVYERIAVVSGGSTTGLAADYTNAEIGCSADSASPDAVYRFSLSQPTRVRLDTIGSSFDTVIGLSDGALGAQQPLSIPVGTADTQELPYDVGDMIGAWWSVSGSTAGLAPNYREAFIGCSADTFSRDAVIKFSLTAPTRVRLDTTGSAFDTVISLHDGDIDPTTPLITDNTNETAGAPMVLGGVDNAWFEVFGGDTTLMRADYDENIIGCGADTYSADAVFAFIVASDATVRIDTLGSAFDTVISLHDAPPPIDTYVDVTANDGSPIDLGSIDSKSQVFRGSTAGLAANYGGAGMGCGTEETPADAAFKFRVSSPTEIEINTEGSDFDTAIGLFPGAILDPVKPAAVAANDLNETKVSALDVTATTPLVGAWKVYSGSTSSMTADMPAIGGAPASARDAVFKFTLGAGATVVLDSQGSAIDTVLGLYDHATDALIASDDNSGGGTAAYIKQALAAGTYYVVVKGARSATKGAYQLSLRDAAVANPIACNDDAFVSGRSRIVAQLLPGDYHVVLKGARAGHAGAFSLRIRDNDWWALSHRLECDDNDGGGTISMIERALTAGTYYVVVKGDLAVDEGPFMLTVRSVSSPVTTSHTVSCNDDLSAMTTASALEADLLAGEYWAVVKGKPGGSGPFTLEMRDIGPAAQGLVLACDDDGVGVTSTASQIERDLGAGNYYVFVKGDAAGDQGSYALAVRDVGSTTSTPLACHDDVSMTDSASQIVRDLAAGDYFVTVKGDAAADAGDYLLTLRDMTSASRTELACDADGSGSVALPAGAYDVVLKGANNDQAGSYALTIGDGQTQLSTFVPPQWNDTLNALGDRDVRVITVLNCHDNGLHGDGRDCDYAHQQADDLANATDALGPNLEPLVVDIDANGAGIEMAIMDQLNLLSGHLEMDVSARVVFEPDANPGFLVSVTAQETPGDGCDPPIGLEFQNCRPGATPRFVISITNPLASPVPLNPADPNGGYNFRADLIADRKYFVDAVPIYVIPKDVNNSLPDPVYALETTGTYFQDVTAPGCESTTERPTWENLYWTAELPVGTGITFNVCTADTLEALATCTFDEVANVTGTNTCSTDADCTNGFCAANGVCQIITSGTCVNDDTCPSGSTCDTMLGTCVFGGQPVFVGSVLNGSGQNLNSFAYLRMNIELRANTATNEGPVVHDWALTYTCFSVN